jgi:transcriptional regulator with XRE-family HTH domain
MERDTALGALIRKQRELQELSLRQLANLAGISNPYLSQIERGLRDPSEKVLEALAQNLELSAEALYEQAGRPRHRPDAPAPEDPEPNVVTAVKSDSHLTAAQREALLEVYAAFTARRRR